MARFRIGEAKSPPGSSSCISTSASVSVLRTDPSGHDTEPDYHGNPGLTCTNWSGVAELCLSEIQFGGIFVIGASDRMTHQARTYTARDNPSADSDDPPHAIESAILTRLVVTAQGPGPCRVKVLLCVTRPPRMP